MKRCQRIPLHSWFGGLSALFLVLGFSSGAQAGGAFATLDNGTPWTWAGNKVTYRLETGGLRGADAGADSPNTGGGGGASSGGCALDKGATTKALEISATEFQDMVRAAAQVWRDAAGGDLIIEEGASLGTNVGYSNAENFIAGDFPGTGDVSNVDVNKCYDGSEDCRNPIVSDPFGQVTDAMLGPCARFGTFGITSLLPKTNADGSVTDPSLKSAQMVINGTCLDPAEKGSNSFDCPFSECPKELTKADVQSVITHEFGHFIGLDHSLINKAEDSKCQVGGESGSCNWEALPTMIGLFRPFANLHTLLLDDIAAVRRYYSTAAKNATGGMCTIKGTVYNTRTPPKTAAKELRCAEVVAKKDGSDLSAAGFVSGSEAPRVASNGKVNDCSTANPGCGAFEIRGLPAGTYTMGVHDFKPVVSSDDITDFNIEPCHGPLGSADNPNIANSDNDPAMEPPGVGAVAVTVTCPAGGGVQTVDLFMN